MNPTNMHGEPNLPVRRSAVLRAQRLGFLPTMAVWNDPEMQRLVFPILVVTSLPLFPLMLYLQRVLEVST